MAFADITTAGALRQSLDANNRFAELLRASIQGYLQAPFNPQEQLQGNLNVIESSIKDPASFRTLDVQLIGNLCSNTTPADMPHNGPLACIRLPRSETTKAFVVDGGPLDGIPLVIVSPGNGYAIQSFGNLVDAKDVKAVELGRAGVGWR